MATDEERPIADNGAPKGVEQVSEQDAPLTKEESAEQIQLLAERARDAGLDPLRAMVQTYASQGVVLRDAVLSAVGRFLAGLENADSPKKKK